MKVKRMGITEILKRIWLFSANKIKNSESGSKQPTQLIVELISSLRHIIVTIVGSFSCSRESLASFRAYLITLLIALNHVRTITQSNM